MVIGARASDREIWYWDGSLEQSSWVRIFLFFLFIRQFEFLMNGWSNRDLSQGEGHLIHVANTFMYTICDGQ